jgi:Na+/H+ antiporter NhaA
MCISGTIAWLVAVVVSIIGANWYKGAANIAISLLVSAMLQAKVLKWIDDPMIQVAFVVIRITECASAFTCSID